MAAAGPQLGDVVRGRFCDGEWYLGTVEQDNGDGTYTLAWFDGDARDRVKALADLRLVRYCRELQSYRDAEAQPVVSPHPVVSHDEPGSGRIEVLVRHPFTEAQVRVTVPRHAKFKHIKKALAQIAHAPQRGELMRHEGGRYRGYKDNALVGDVREVLTTQSDLASGSVALDEGDVSMDDEHVPSRRAGEDPSSSSCQARSHLAPGSRVEVLDGHQAGGSGVVVEAPVETGMISVMLDSSRTVHAVRTLDCLRLEEQAGADSAAETIKRLMRLKEEPQEELSAAWEALQLEPGTAMLDIDRQFRRLSVRIHPDKCKLPHASDAFQVLVRAHDRLKCSQTGAATRATDARGGLTLEDARSLLEDLRDAFTKEEFSAKLEALEFQRDCYGSTAAFLRDRHALFTGVHATVLPRHGFEGTETGVYRMLGQMGDLMEDERLSELATELNSRLGLELLPPRWGRVASACRKHAEREARPAPALLGYHGIMLGAGGLLALAAPQQAATAAPAAKRDDAASQLWPADKRPPFRLFVAGTWRDFAAEVMRWERGLFLHQVTVSAQGTERFHLLKNGSSEGKFYPDTEDASPFEGFTTLGPDSGPDSEGSSLNWQIGKHKEEEIRPGSRVVIVVALDAQGSLSTVDWQRGQLAAPSTSTGGFRGPPSTATTGGGGSMPDECLLPWETGEAPAWEAELDGIGA